MHVFDKVYLKKKIYLGKQYLQDHKNIYYIVNLLNVSGHVKHIIMTQNRSRMGAMGLTLAHHSWSFTNLGLGLWVRT